MAPDADASLAEELRELVAHELGRPFKPSRVVLVEALPKTRSAKILRRAVRAAAVGEDPGDLSSAENPQSLDGIRAALAALSSAGPIVSSSRSASSAQNS